MQEVSRKQHKSKTGTVISDKMDKTIVVKVQDRAVHKLYKKIIRRDRKVTAHDPKNSAKIGNKVKIIECRPLSKQKRWRLQEILK